MNEVILESDHKIRKSRKKTQKAVFVIGYNYFGELNPANKCDCLKLTRFKVLQGDITNIYSGNGTTVCQVYDDLTDNKGLYITGKIIHNRKYVKYKNMKTIFTNVCSDSIFIKTKQHKIFAKGRISQLGLGHTQKPFDRRKPTSINYFNHDFYDNIADIQSGTQYSIALCGYPSSIDATIIIIQNWAKSIKIPVDVIKLLRKYYYIPNKVYITSQIKYTHYSLPQKIKPCDDYKRCNHDDHYFCHAALASSAWNKMESIAKRKPRHVIKIAAAASHCLLLERNGDVWRCEPEQTTVNYQNTQQKQQKKVHFSLQKIWHFSNRKIRIKDIKCGNEHNLAVDYDGKLYCWGSNKMGQCGILKSKSKKDFQLASWMKSMGALQHKKYYRLFVENGLDSIETLQRLTETQLEMIVGDFYDRQLLVAEIVFLRKYGCRDESMQFINKPHLVKKLVQYEICEIECGYTHSYCKTSKDKHFMFGSNRCNECIMYDEKVNMVISPHRVDDIIKREIQCLRLNIQSVSLGYYNTKIIVLR